MDEPKYVEFKIHNEREKEEEPKELTIVHHWATIPVDSFLADMLNRETTLWNATVTGSFEPPTKKELRKRKIKRILSYPSDFIDYIKSYRYEDWRYHNDW